MPSQDAEEKAPSEMLHRGLIRSRFGSESRSECEGDRHRFQADEDRDEIDAAAMIIMPSVAHRIK
jgi:hypothetical protein